MAKKTTSQSLDTLFDTFVEVLRDRLTSETATAADLNVVRQFLKENGVDYVGEKSDNSAEEQQRLAEILPFTADLAANS